MAAPSIYQQIRAQAATAPDVPLNPDAVDDDEPRAEPGQPRLARGFRDTLAGDPDGGEERVRRILQRVGRGEIDDWSAVDAVTATVHAATNVDALIDGLRPWDVNADVKRVFWELARSTRRIESVKWGIAVGSFDLEPAELPTLMTLARHSEFTLFCAHALHRGSRSHPEYRLRLVELLSTTRRWGVIRTIDFVVADPELIAKRDVQREVLVRGMANCDGLAMHVAATIARAVDVSHFLIEARTDPRVRTAVFDLMDTLLTEPQPHGGLAELDGWVELYDAFVTLVEHSDVDIRVLAACANLATFLELDATDWPRRSDEIARLETMGRDTFDAALLAEALASDTHRWSALEIIKQREARELLPAVREAFDRTPDWLSIRVLGELGDSSDLERLLGAIPRLVDVDARTGRPHRAENVFGESERNAFEYGEILSLLGRLDTSAAAEAIRRGLDDYHPQVRAAACRGAEQLSPDTVAEPLRTRLLERIDEPPEYVAQSARRAAAALGVLPAE